MIISYPPAMRRQLLSKHFLISTMPEQALDELIKFSTVARFDPHQGEHRASAGGSEKPDSVTPRPLVSCAGSSLT
jgi:hypothetical protein